MMKEKLERMVETTKLEIYQLKEQLDQVTDPQEEKELLVKLKEQQIKQMWCMDQLQTW
jgi:RNase adaptor protein for sRNA GlmZ degradation